MRTVILLILCLSSLSFLSYCSNYKRVNEIENMHYKLIFNKDKTFNLVIRDRWEPKRAEGNYQNKNDTILLINKISSKDVKTRIIETKSYETFDSLGYLKYEFVLDFNVTKLNSYSNYKLIIDDSVYFYFPTSNLSSSRIIFKYKKNIHKICIFDDYNKIELLNYKNINFSSNLYFINIEYIDFEHLPKYYLYFDTLVLIKKDKYIFAKNVYNL